MDQEAYQARCDLIFNRLARKNPATRIASRETIANSVRAAEASWLAACVVIPVGVAAAQPGVVWAHVGVIGIVGLIGSAMVDFSKKIGDLYLRARSLSRPLTTYQANHIKDWSAEHPRLVEILSNWAAENSDSGIGMAHYNKVKKAVSRIVEAKNLHDLHCKDVAERERVRETMTDAGILPLANFKKISRSTPQASGETRHKRL